MRAASGRQVRLFALSDQRKQDAVFDDGGHVEKVYGQWVSGDAFAILGVKPALGRVLASTDDINPGQHPVAVLSYDFWTRRFGRNPDVLGRWVTIREKPLQIVGVAAKGFTGVAPGVMTDVWAPTMMWDDRMISDPGTRWFGSGGGCSPAPRRSRRDCSADGLQQVRPRSGGQAARGIAGAARISSSTLASTCDRPRPAYPGCARTSRARLWVLGGIAAAGAARRLHERREPAGGTRARRGSARWRCGHRLAPDVAA